MQGAEKLPDLVDLLSKAGEAFCRAGQLDEAQAVGAWIFELRKHDRANCPLCERAATVGGKARRK